MNKICFVCGIECDSCLCDGCRDKVDIEDLCNRVIKYTPLIKENPNANPLWDKIAQTVEYPQRFQDFASELAEILPSPRKEYQVLKSFYASG